VTRRARARQAARSVRPVYWLLGLHGVSSFCYGMVLPYTSIFLSEQDGVGTGGVAAYYAASGVANMAVAAVLALGWFRPPRIALGVAGNALSALGYLVLPVVSSAPQAALAAIAVGAGQGCFLAAVIPIVSSLIEESETRRVFALRYQILNATFALGSLAAGVLTILLTSSVLPYLFVVCAVGYLPIAFALLVTRGASEAGREARRSASEAAGGNGPLPMGLLLRAALGVIVFEVVVALFAFAQFEGTAPLVAYRLMDVGLSWIPVLIAINVAVIVFAQPLMTRIIEPRGDVFGLRAAVGLWVAGYALVGLAALAGGPFALPGLLGYAVLFGLGECAYSCSFYPWMIGKVPDAELTRITALTNGMMGIGLFAGPPIGIALVGGGSAALVWFSLAALCAVAVLGTLHGGARRVDNVPAANGAG
jgi:MFS family permease